MMQDGSKRAIIAAFFANLGIAVSKFVGFLHTG
ncbi:MAG: cation transporter, partial [Actinobacteria bacterium]|nr:cation transporter [Actinomycetota bacterium]